MNDTTPEVQVTAVHGAVLGRMSKQLDDHQAEDRVSFADLTKRLRTLETLRYQIWGAVIAVSLVVGAIAAHAKDYARLMVREEMTKVLQEHGLIRYANERTDR